MKEFPEDYVLEEALLQLSGAGRLKALATLVDTHFETVKLSEPFLNIIFTQALDAKHGNLLTTLLNRYDHSLLTRLSSTDICKQLISNGQTTVVLKLNRESFLNALDINTLYQQACESQQLAALEWVLSFNKLTLDNAALRMGLETLFKNKSYDQVLDSVYQTGSSRLYQLIIKLQYPHPRASLLASIQHPMQDPKLQNTALYLDMLKRALEKNDEKQLDNLLNDQPDSELLQTYLVDFIELNQDKPRIIDLLLKQHALEKLCDLTLRQKQWPAVALMLEHKDAQKFSPTLLKKLESQKENITRGYLQLKEKQSKQNDIRSGMFSLIIAPPEASILAKLTQDSREAIHQTLIKIEEQMLREKRNLHGQVYRMTMSNEPFKRRLDMLKKDLENLKAFLRKKRINLKEPLYDLKVIKCLQDIKEHLTALEMTNTRFLIDEDEELLEQLMSNPRFETILKLEQSLYYLIIQNTRHHNPERSFSDWPHAQQDIFFEKASALDAALKEQRLEIGFLLPELTKWMAFYKKEIEVRKLKEEQDLQDELRRNEAELLQHEKEQQRQQEELRLQDEPKPPPAQSLPGFFTQNNSNPLKMTGEPYKDEYSEELVPDCNPFSDISMLVLEGFIAALGVAVIAVAFVLLNAATFGIPGLVAAGVGVGLVASGVGLFARTAYKSSKEESSKDEDENEALIKKHQ